MKNNNNKRHNKFASFYQQMMENAKQQRLMSGKNAHHVDEHHRDLPSVTAKQLQASRLQDEKFYKQEQETKARREKHINKERRKFLDMLGKTGISMSAFRNSSILTGAMASSALA